MLRNVPDRGPVATFEVCFHAPLFFGYVSVAIEPPKRVVFYG
jgi:hypothetical protein